MQPLQDVTVVSLEQAIAAPYASRHLADLGARVIKVERPGVGDFARSYDSRVKGLSSHFVWVKRNKESLTLDIKDRRGMGVLRQLLAGADVFIQNLAPGTAARAGLGVAELQARERWHEVATSVGPVPSLALPGPATSEPRMDPVPELGHHTRAILTELGMDSGDVNSLMTEGVA
jgi:crotonobetainyl-CoA:carnitine CoA-transferase CaiB-like acyl-CoA transferase